MIHLYMDENVRGPITEQLQRKSFDVLRAQDDIPAGTPDDEVLSRATALGRVLYSECSILPRFIFVSFVSVS